MSKSHATDAICLEYAQNNRVFNTIDAVVFGILPMTIILFALRKLDDGLMLCDEFKGVYFSLITFIVCQIGGSIFQKSLARWNLIPFFAVIPCGPIVIYASFHRIVYQSYRSQQSMDKFESRTCQAKELTSRESGNSQAHSYSSFFVRQKHDTVDELKQIL